MDSHVDLLQVAKETDGFSGSDLKEMCRDAALLCVREYVNNACEEDVYVGPAARSQLLLVLPGELGTGRGSHRAGGSRFPAPLPLYTETPTTQLLLLLLLLALKIRVVVPRCPSWRWPEPASPAVALVSARLQCW